MGRRAAFHSLGCRVNAYETEAMTEQLRQAGYTIVPFESAADVYVINTCTVTNIADRKSRQMLHRAKELNPDAVVVAAGCYAEDEAARCGTDPAVDLTVGNHGKSKLALILEEYFEHRDPLWENPDISTVKEYDGLAISDTEERARAFIKIQDGCNQFCSYCVIPYVRGRVRSRQLSDVLDEAGRLAEAGFREVVLTGIHLSSYGLDFLSPGRNLQTPDASAAETNRLLLTLIRETAEIPGIERIRMGSLEPGIMTEEFVSEIAALPAVCPHFHLSLQSGCDATLQRMKRKYTTADFRKICERLRAHFDRPAITTDLIAGFPGETDEEFRMSLDFAREMQFAKMHVFKYSRRDGTKAAEMSGQISETVKKERSRLLLELDRQAHAAYAGSFAGETVEVLFEETETRGGRTFSTGHTRHFLEVCAEGSAGAGTVRRCTVTGLLDDGRLAVSLREK